MAQHAVAHAKIVLYERLRLRLFEASSGKCVFEKRFESALQASVLPLFALVSLCLGISLPAGFLAGATRFLDDLVPLIMVKQKGTLRFANPSGEVALRLPLGLLFKFNIPHLSRVHGGEILRDGDGNFSGSNPFAASGKCRYKASALLGFVAMSHR